MEKRYEKNIGMISLEEMEIIKLKKVCVVGCGGLGGYIIEMLARLGVGYLTVVDSDVFDESNLNRQLLSDKLSLGKEKAVKAKERISIVNSLVEVNAITLRLTEKNASEILNGHDVVIDAVDSISSRFMLQEICEKEKIPFIHGAIAGWYGQVSTIFPGDKTLDLIYSKESRVDKGIENILGNPSFTPALIASIQVSEALKVLIGRGEVLRNKMLCIDTLEQEYNVVNIKK